MDAHGHAIAMEPPIPAGAFGPQPMTLHMSAYLVSHASGLILVDTGTDPTGHAPDAVLRQLDAPWSDVWDVLITHIRRAGSRHGDGAARRCDGDHNGAARGS